jgi:hypothetical protein
MDDFIRNNGQVHAGATFAHSIAHARQRPSSLYRQSFADGSAALTGFILTHDHRFPRNDRSQRRVRHDHTAAYFIGPGRRGFDL